jgi:3'(2'), 5'-bisphosphate nucleotidase
MQQQLAMAVQKTGIKILECQQQGNISGKWEGTQFKAAADLIADECLRGELWRIAQIPVISEEDDLLLHDDRPSRYWLIDPIDGTASFAHGFSGFVCQAALMVDGEPSLASVYAPALKKLYAAERGRGATLNGRPLRVKPLDRTLLSLVDNYPEPRGVAERLYRDLACARYVESGSIGLKICLVAEGVADIFIKDVCVRDWDIAPPYLILQEAGGIIAQYSGQPFEFRREYEKLGLIAASSLTVFYEICEVVEGYQQTL